MKIILASKSPRRKELLNTLHVDYDIEPAISDEIYKDNLSSTDQCIDIAYNKALEIFNNHKNEDLIVIGVDTVVIVDNEILGKPKDRMDAYRMIKLISNRSHLVVSGYSILVRQNKEEKIIKGYDSATVFVDNLTDNEINSWLDEDTYMDKAGAYAIQQSFGKYISSTNGDYNSIVGFPLNKIYNELKKYM